MRLLMAMAMSAPDRSLATLLSYCISCYWMSKCAFFDWLMVFGCHKTCYYNVIKAVFIYQNGNYFIQNIVVYYSWHRVLYFSCVCVLYFQRSALQRLYDEYCLHSNCSPQFFLFFTWRFVFSLDALLLVESLVFLFVNSKQKTLNNNQHQHQHQQQTTWYFLFKLQVLMKTLAFFQPKIFMDILILKAT